MVAGLGLVLAVVRFDRLLLPRLSALAALLPSLVPMAFEGARRRWGRIRRAVIWWMWAPGSVVAICLTLVGRPEAPLAGLTVAAIATAVRHGRTGRARGTRCVPVGRGA